MAPLVVFHVSFCPKGFATALWAGEWPLVSMNALVDLEVLLLRKGLIAAGKGTFERLSASVKVNMGLQTNLSAESLGTAWKWAFKHLLRGAWESIIDICSLFGVGPLITLVLADSIVTCVVLFSSIPSLL